MLSRVYFVSCKLYYLYTVRFILQNSQCTLFHIKWYNGCTELHCLSNNVQISCTTFVLIRTTSAKLCSSVVQYLYLSAPPQQNCLVLLYSVCTYLHYLSNTVQFSCTMFVLNCTTSAKLCRSVVQCVYLSALHHQNCADQLYNVCTYMRCLSKTV